MASIRGLKDTQVVTTEDLQWVEAHLTPDLLRRKLSQLDDAALAVATLGDGLHAMLLTLRTDALALANSPAKQLELYAAIAARLEKEGDFFDPYGENPALVGPEKVLAMKYSDAVQPFWLAPWSGVPIRVQEPKFEFSGTTVIPIIDAIGVRVQFSDSRWADFRLAGGLAMFEGDFKTDAEGESVADPDDATRSTAEIAISPQLNASLGNIKIGAGYIVTNDTAAAEGLARVRIFLGADLVKMITGFNLGFDLGDT